MMSKFDLRWPAEVKATLDVASAAAANVEVASPECTVEWNLRTKFVVVETLPLVAAAVCLIIVWVKFKWKQRAALKEEAVARELSPSRPHPRRDLWRHSHRVVGAFVIIMCVSSWSVAHLIPAHSRL